jgi:hypothetical protein
MINGVISPDEFKKWIDQHPEETKELIDMVGQP